MRTFRLVALTPPGQTDPSIAIAASRAGALGVLDLEYLAWDDAAATATAVAAIDKLATFARAECGVKLDGRGADFYATLTELTEGARLPDPIKVVILTPADSKVLAPFIETLHGHGLTVLLEATSLEEARLGVRAQADGLIAKGNEAAGWVGEETTFILVQRFLNDLSLPVWAQGGMGAHTAAACFTAGAVGAVLDYQLALQRESTLPGAAQEIVSARSGREARSGLDTVCVGQKLGAPFRILNRSGSSMIDTLRHEEEMILSRSGSRAKKRAAWREKINAIVGWDDPISQIVPFCTDASVAAGLRDKYLTVGRALEGLRETIDAAVDAARATRPFDAAAPLAVSHGTPFPIVQTPMIGISDQAAFGLRIAEEGALPFLALGHTSGAELTELLAEWGRLLDDRPWGVGLLGSLPAELAAEQVEAVRAIRPAFGMISGDADDEVLAMADSIGAETSVYVHAHSRDTLATLLARGTKRFIFEGCESGGRVGPRTSFELWTMAVDVLLEEVAADNAADYHVLFGGGIHDSLSASMAAAVAAPLAERGIKVGVLMGTPYLFTEDAVEAKAIVKAYQQEVLDCSRTELVETAPGYAVRCADTPFSEAIMEDRERLSEAGRSAAEIQEELETLVLDRLRIASKGLKRRSQPASGDDDAPYVTVRSRDQYAKGAYMLGQSAAFNNEVRSVEDLHAEVTVDGSDRIDGLEDAPLSDKGRRRVKGPEPSDVAIVGMACFMPKAGDVQTYWENILGNVDAVTEVSKLRWDWERYFDADMQKRDKSYSRWGGFLDDVAFDPMKFGMPPLSLRSIDPIQLLTLECARQALEDSGYDERPFDRERCAVISGMSGGAPDLAEQYAFRTSLSMFIKNVPEEILSQLPEWTEDSFAGILPNVSTGRVANRLDLNGCNFVVDAACASSLAAFYSAVRELEMGSSDMVLCGAADTMMNPFAYLCFSKTQALSPRGLCRPFDQSADGITIGEGFGFLVLKRLADAERDGDKIYAVVKGIGASSDGKDKGLTAPRPEGQAIALRRAYEKAGFPPATVGLVEGHGTGTRAGEEVEVSVLKEVFEEGGSLPKSTVVGSVKSSIGHLKSSAGLASLLKVTKALHHKVAPPMIGVEEPNSILQDSPFFVNREARPWIHGIADHPRRAGVSSFGFGGTNFHVVLEEYTGDFVNGSAEAVTKNWSSELFLFRGDDEAAINALLDTIEKALDEGADPALRDLAFSLWQAAKDESGPTLTIIATSLDDLKTKIGLARGYLAKDDAKGVEDPRGIYFTRSPLAREGKVGFLFSGQGSPYPDMVRVLALHFSEIRERYEIADRLLADQFPRPLHSYVFPPPHFTEEEEKANMEALMATNVAQPAIGATDMGLLRLMESLGVEPETVAGHSYGEYVALCAAGVFDEEELYPLSEARGRFIVESAEGEFGDSAGDLGTMAAVEAERGQVQEVIEPLDGVWIANLNSPMQTVISGTREGIKKAVAQLEEAGLSTREVAVSCAFHSPLISEVQDRLKGYLDELVFSAPTKEVFSNTTAQHYPTDPKEIATLLGEHLTRPVEFAKEIEAMYEAGTRIFIEAGPRRVLANLTQQILADKKVLALPLDQPGRDGILHLHHVLGQIASHEVPVNLDRLFEGRGVRHYDLDTLAEEAKDEELSRTTWMVNGGRARPLHEEDREKVPIDLVPADQVKVVEKVVEKVFEKIVEPALEPAPAPAAPAPAAAAPAPEQTPIAPESSPTPAVAPRLTAPARSAADDELDRIMLDRHQKLMQQFLETQQKVMTAFLEGTGAEATLQADVRDGLVAEPQVAAPSVSAAPPAASAGPPAAPAGPPAAPAGPPAAPAGAPATLTPPAAAVSPAPAPALAPAPAPTPLPVAPAAAPAPAPAETAPVAASVAAAAPAPAAAMDTDKIEARLLEIVSDRTGYPPDMLDLDLDLEADLGIDSIKRVEILGVVQQDFPELGEAQDELAQEELGRQKTLRGIIDWIGANLQAGPEAEPAPAAAPTAAPAQAGSAPAPAAPVPSPAPAPAAPTPTPESAIAVSAPPPAGAVETSQIEARLLEIVSDRTGYPPDMLDLDLDLEADLGIDSIKRVEILGVVQQDFPELGEAQDELAQEELGRQKTLRGIIDWIGANLQAGPEAEPAPAAAPTAAPAQAGSAPAPAAPVPSPAPAPAAPTPTPESAIAVSAPPPAGAVETSQIEARLLEIVSDRTGYPPDMLDLDLDLEADLGIDSIKRVEILGVVQQDFPALGENQDELAQEELGRQKTLRGIIDWIGANLNGDSSAPGAEPSASAPAPSAPAHAAPPAAPAADVDYGSDVGVPRFLMNPVELPLPERSLNITAGSVFIITDDGTGISENLSDEIVRLGGRVALVQSGDRTVHTGEGVYEAKLGDPDETETLVNLIREQGPIAGIIHLSPLLKRGGDYEAMSIEGWQAALRHDVKSLYLLTRLASADIRRAAGTGGGWLVAACATEVATDDGGGKIASPEHGGVTGFIKTIASEWYHVNSKVLDFDLTLSPDAMARCILREMAYKNGELEILYRGSNRIVLRADLSPLDVSGQAAIAIAPDWVILVTGGATGITAAVSLEMARNYRPTLVLAGIETWPGDEEDAATAGIDDPAAVKKALIEQFRQQGDFSLGEVEAAFNRLMREREMRSNVDALRAAGSTVEYFQVDVRDEAGFGGLIDAVYERYGRIDGMIHGAGIIADKLVEDKVPESFDRVFDTKADSAFILSRTLRGDSLRFLVFFCSVAGQFGSRGQCDYSATNEVVGRLCLRLNADWPTRVIAANWGPWAPAAAGMVSAEVQKQFAQKGVQMIPQAAGPRLLDREIRFGHKDNVFVVFGDGLWSASGVPGVFPLLDLARFSVPPSSDPGAELPEIRRPLDPELDIYLKDHLLDDKPVFPFAMGMEFMGEAVRRIWPRMKIVGMESFRVFRGIVVDGPGHELLIKMRPLAESPSADASLAVEVEIAEASKPELPSHRAVVLLGDTLPEQPTFDAELVSSLGPFPKTTEEAYLQWLFHGPCFQGITRIEGASEDGIAVRLRSHAPIECFSHLPPGQWAIDPVVMDSAFQPALLWERVYHDMTPLPSGFASFRLFGSLSQAPLLCHLQTNSSSDGHILMTNIFFVDENQRQVARLEGMEFSCSAELNRLAGKVKTYRGESR